MEREVRKNTALSVLRKDALIGMIGKAAYGFGKGVMQGKFLPTLGLTVATTETVAKKGVGGIRSSMSSKLQPKPKYDTPKSVLGNIG